MVITYTVVHFGTSYYLLSNFLRVDNLGALLIVARRIAWDLCQLGMRLSLGIFGLAGTDIPLANTGLTLSGDFEQEPSSMEALITLTSDFGCPLLQTRCLQTILQGLAVWLQNPYCLPCR